LQTGDERCRRRRRRRCCCCFVELPRVADQSILDNTDDWPASRVTWWRIASGGGGGLARRRGGGRRGAASAGARSGVMVPETVRRRFGGKIDPAGDRRDTLRTTGTANCPARRPRRHRGTPPAGWAL